MPPASGYEVVTVVVALPSVPGVAAPPAVTVLPDTISVCRSVSRPSSSLSVM